MSGINFIKYANKKFKNGAIIASVIGGFYAMDRIKMGKNKKSYDLLINGKGIKSKDLNESILKSYKKELQMNLLNLIINLINMVSQLEKLKMMS